jgi:YHS domain-containing protein
MFRWLIELIVGFIVAMAARAILRSVMQGFTNAANPAGGEQPAASAKQQPKERIVVAGELHKDPVCGMYVAESTQYQRKSGRDSFYYCSEECKSKHALAAHT